MELLLSKRGILIIILVIIGIISTLRRPKSGFAVILILVILRRGLFLEWFPLVYELHLPQIFIILTLVSWLLHSNRYPLCLNYDVFLMFLFFAVICYSRYNFGTPVFEHKIPNEIFREFVIFFLAIQLLREPKDIRNILWLIVGLHLFLALRAYYFYKVDFMPIAMPTYRYLGRNSFAGSLAFTFPVAYILSRTAKNKIPKLLAMFAAAWCVIGVILTYSRGGFVALMAGICALIFFERKKWRIISVVLILSILILPRLSEKYINRVQSIETYHEDSAAMARVGANYAAINMIKENPIFGVGAGNYNDLVMDYVPIEYRQNVAYGLSIHNVIMQATSETGIVGAVIFLLLVFGGFKNTFIGKGARNKDSGLYELALMLRIALFAVFIAQQFGQGAYYGNLYLILPLASSLKTISRNMLQYKYV